MTLSMGGNNWTLTERARTYIRANTAFIWSSAAKENFVKICMFRYKFYTCIPPICMKIKWQIKLLLSENLWASFYFCYITLRFFVSDYLTRNWYNTVSWQTFVWPNVCHSLNVYLVLSIISQHEFSAHCGPLSMRTLFIYFISLYILC